MSTRLYHYTDRNGYNGIRASPDWVFKATQPPNPAAHPKGAYFTTLPEGTTTLAKRLRHPKRKLESSFRSRTEGT
jgi:hypothetical protein